MTIQFKNAPTDSINGTCLQGYIETTYDELVSVFGEPTTFQGDKITAEWLQVKTITTPDKNAIKDAIKKGTKVEGAAVINRINWKIN